MSAHDSGQAGALTDVAITPQMIEAGVVALNANIGEDGSRMFGDQEIVREIVRSCLSASLQSGAPRRLHDLRHSAVSNMVNSGQSLYVVGQVLGHAQPRTTQRYAHLSQDTLLSAADAGAEAAGW